MQVIGRGKSLLAVMNLGSLQPAAQSPPCGKNRSAGVVLPAQSPWTVASPCFLLGVYADHRPFCPEVLSPAPAAWCLTRTPDRDVFPHHFSQRVRGGRYYLPLRWVSSGLPLGLSSSRLQQSARGDAAKRGRPLVLPALHRRRRGQPGRRGELFNLGHDRKIIGFCRLCFFCGLFKRDESKRHA